MYQESRTDNKLATNTAEVGNMQPTGAHRSLLNLAAKVLLLGKKTLVSSR